MYIFIKRFFLTIWLVFLSFDLFAFDYEKKINDNFHLSQKLNKDFKEIESLEQNYVDKIVKLKLKFYILKRKKESLERAYELNKTELINGDINYFDKKIEKYIKVLDIIDESKKCLPGFIYQEFLNKKNIVKKILGSDSDKIKKITTFFNFLEKEIDNCSDIKISEEFVMIGGKKYRGKLINGGDIIILFKSGGDLFAWNKNRLIFEKKDDKRSDSIDDVIRSKKSNFSTDSSLYPLFIRKKLI